MTASEFGGVVLPAATLAATLEEGTPEWTESDPGDISAQSSFSRMSCFEGEGRKKKITRFPDALCTMSDGTLLNIRA